MHVDIPILLNAFLISVVLIPVLGKVAEPIGLVDVPTARKIHEGKIPLTGGLAIFAAFLISVLLAVGTRHAQWDLLTGVAILVLVGLVDDLFDIRASTRLAVQVCAASIMIVPGWHVISDLPNPFGSEPIELGLLALPFTMFFVVGLINAFNMLDGVDGLAGGAAAAAFFWLGAGVAASGSGERSELLILLCATLGFLVFNMRHPWRSRAVVFMGNAGSMMLGAFVAFYILVLDEKTESPNHFVSLLWIIAIPAIDTLTLIARRVAAGRSPLSADREHLHHLLLEYGLSPKATAASIAVLCFVVGGIGVLSARLGVSDIALLWGLLALLTGHTCFVWWGRKRIKGVGLLMTESRIVPAKREVHST